MTKDFEEIEQIRQILISRGYNELADLLRGCWGEVANSGQFGNYSYSTISSYLIHSPFKLMLEQNNIDDEDRNVIFQAILLLYLHKDNAPEIRSISFVVDKELKIDDSFLYKQKKVQNKKGYNICPKCI